MKCPHCDREIELEKITYSDPEYSKGVARLTAEAKTNRIWQTAENLATNAQFEIPSKSRSKEKLLELFKYYLKELMESEG